MRSSACSAFEINSGGRLDWVCCHPTVDGFSVRIPIVESTPQACDYICRGDSLVARRGFEILIPSIQHGLKRGLDQ